MKLHLGCGTRFLPGYVHVDLNACPTVDVVGPVNELGWVKDGLISEIYAANCLQYFDRWEAREVLAEWHRVLSPGGTLRLSVSDLAAIIEHYNGDADDRGILGPIFGRIPSDQHGMIYQRTIYDFKSLARLLDESGFENIDTYDWADFLPEGYDDQSKAYMPHMDVTGRLMVLNMKATKK